MKAQPATLAGVPGNGFAVHVRHPDHDTGHGRFFAARGADTKPLDLILLTDAEPHVEFEGIVYSSSPRGSQRAKVRVLLHDQNETGAYLFRLEEIPS